MKPIERSTFFSKKVLLSLIGVDYELFERSGRSNAVQFAMTGIFVILILIISFLSVFYAFDLMFDKWHAELLLSLFFSVMFFNLYVFLIQTFSKESFPGFGGIKILNTSNLSRLGFVLLLGFLIAQPVRIFLLRSKLDVDIADFKAKLYQSFAEKNARLYSTEINNLHAKKQRFIMLGGETAEEEIIQVDKELTDINQTVEQANALAAATIDDSSFFIKRIELSNRYPQTTIITTLVLIIFLMPVALIYFVPTTSHYYKQKKENERSLILTNYGDFKIRYKRLFQEKYGLKDIQFYEHFDDPPFNSLKKSNGAYLNQDEFFERLTGHE
ncbi:DUF4407 domain-containing protein [Pedobacter sp. HMF7647]|uniref:DUF4407 domain-containing protein n=1 Tax=Hufsiella arboris TaxID=2695275 RepID=A0A7K1Y8G5_9SPHI|nr:DUF4407 domain-containing protein [Hufsiella arboris]MXV50338.1 DUF4407 domain-containing protein [Hufsiella arboris]